jgi:2-oxo-3-hexenedioate decarboxylase/2-keto-4-pentenoate hydratase
MGFVADDRIARAAEVLCRARLEGAVITPLAEDIRPRSEDEAYLVQDELHRLLTEAGYGEIAGYKIGCTTPVMQEALGLDHPVFGGIFAPMVWHDELEIEARRFVGCAIESEIAVRVDRDMTDTQYDRESAAAAVGSCIGAIEVMDNRYGERGVLDMETRVADDFYNGGSLLGPELRDFDPRELDGVKTRLLVNGEEVGTGSGDMVLGHPLEALAWIANTLVARGNPLRAGQFVSLGSVIRGQPMEAGDEAVVIHDPLGEVRIRYV